MFPTNTAEIIARIEAAAAWGGCSVNTMYEYLVYLSLRAAAMVNAEFLSECARSFFNV